MGRHAESAVRSSGKALVSGLTKGDAAALADALEAARTHWWQHAIATRTELLQSVDERLMALSSPRSYVRHSVFLDLKRDAESVAESFSARWPDSLTGTPEIQMLSEIQAFLRTPDGFRERTNEWFVADETSLYGPFFDRVEVQPLTDEQRRAVVIDEDRNLVVAAAGSGKTSVIVAKAGWLTWREYRQPKELLVLAYAKAAQKDLGEGGSRDRLGGKAARGLTVRTFHSLGRAIIAEAEGKPPAVAKVAEDDKALSVLLKDIVEGLLGDEKLSRILRRWFQGFFSPYRSQHEFRNWGEYWDYIREHEIRSLKGDKVKSFEECEIANFLYLNGVSYEYEAQYEHDTRTSQRGQYKPDFHLPDAGIYIEHFALNASGNTPPFIDREEYLTLDGMEAASPCGTRHDPDRDLQLREGRRQADQEPVREAGGARRDPVSDPLRSGVCRSAGTGKGRSVHNVWWRHSSSTSRVPSCRSAKLPSGRRRQETGSGRRPSWPCSSRSSSATRNRSPDRKRLISTI